MSKRYVQHISGQGEKWRVDNDCKYDDCWSVFKTGDDQSDHHFLPLSEYRLCEPPEGWEPIDAHYVHLSFLFDENGKEVRGEFRAKLDTIERKVQP